MKFIIGKKLNMTQVWQGDKLIGVTKIEAGPCVVAQLKNKQPDGYEAVQLGYGQRKAKNIKKPQKGHVAKLKTQMSNVKTNLKYLREFRADVKDLKAGDVIDVSTFAPGDKIKVIGISKGKGFQGSVKRHGFHGHNTTHGTKDQVRTSGSIGAGGPQHVFKGTRMPGRMGNERVTALNLRVVEVDLENNFLYIKGAVPGARNGLVLIQGEGELKIAEDKTEAVKETKVETADGSRETVENTAPALDEKIEAVAEAALEGKKEVVGETKGEEN